MYDYDNMDEKEKKALKCEVSNLSDEIDSDMRYLEGCSDSLISAGDIGYCISALCRYVTNEKKLKEILGNIPADINIWA